MSDLFKSLRARSPAALPDGFAKAPVLDEWSVTGHAGRLIAHGFVSAGGKFAAGSLIHTSEIREIDGDPAHAPAWWIRTRNSLYRLGGPAMIGSPLMDAAASRSFPAAATVVSGRTGKHTLPTAVAGFVDALAQDIVAGDMRRGEAGSVALALVRQGRQRLADAWLLLAADPRNEQQAREIASMLERIPGLQDLAALRRVAAAWRLAASDKIPLFEDIDDHIAAAHAIRKRLEDIDVATALISDTDVKSALSALEHLSETAAERRERDTRGPAWQLPPVPPFERVAMAKTWREAWSIARDFLDGADAAEVDRDRVAELDGPQRMWAMREYAAGWLSDPPQYAIWMLLATNPADAPSVEWVVGKLREFEGSRLAARERWRNLHDDVQLEREIADPDDPFASAWHAYVAETARLLAEMPIDIQPIEPSAAEKPKESDVAADGVVVVEKLGGAEKLDGTRDAKRAYEAIIGKKLPLTPVPPDIDRIRDVLLAEYPHAPQAIKTLLSDLRNAKHVRLKQHTLLVGPPGTGKSRLVRRLGELLSVPVARYDGAGAMDNMFGGVTRSWHGSMPCFPLLALVAPNKRADGIVMIDELDKASTRNHNGTLTNALLPFLEDETAARFPDPYVLAAVDLSHVSYICTANDELLIPLPLRDRLRILRVPEPRAEHLISLARGIVREIAQASGDDVRFFPALDEDEVEIARSLWRGGSVRRLKRVVESILQYRETNPRQ